MGACRDCRHWGASGLNRGNPGTQLKACAKLGASYDYDFDGGLDVTMDMTSTSGDLPTPPDFGCVLFEAKAPT